MIFPDLRPEHSPLTPKSFSVLLLLLCNKVQTIVDNTRLRRTKHENSHRYHPMPPPALPSSRRSSKNQTPHLDRRFGSGQG
ncbi:uncharacterized protein B0I36DRAFT_316022 [Microdochium trichocladiopsis]|uniref:Uncharacterized protein n=1 Tax=Microdochium trichocladiopsis TaxID=1682393 RepID=A0A9P8YG95_9PEZI|nr:uncharacterized protein B0I36DRAFT_316022 [Microdochium trichocladiopsis]KAH7038327.1 hypothetical protein B0I36DRAFT_316022 [Microdochium trichocladiopsis]